MRIIESGQRRFLRRILAEGGEQLGAVVAGAAVFGWRDRTIGAPAIKYGERLWLRATGEHQDWASGDGWTGNRDAASLTGIPKPVLIGRVQWEEPPTVIYAELMTFVPDKPCSITPELRHPFSAPDTWWADLRSALDTLAVQPTARTRYGSEHHSRVERFYGRAIAPATSTRTEHTDLQWSNITTPRLWLLDWEYWGTAPAGYGAAFLHCHSLLVPEAAARVHALFADLLEAPSGRYAQLSVIMAMLRRIDGGDYPELKQPLWSLANRLLAHGRKG